MKLAWATDIHLNFVGAEAARALGRKLAQEGDLVLLAGDIAEAHNLREYLRLLDCGKPIHFVLGNHDFYGGSIAQVRKDVTGLGWLPMRGVVPLTETAALVGVDGWGDGWMGNFERSKVQLNDWIMIQELRIPDRGKRLARLRALGVESAEVLRVLLDEALAKYSRLIVLTHVPPFRESCWHEGRISDDEWLPWFTCKAVGEVLLAAAEQHPRTIIDVYCGHTHGGGVARIRDNLVVHTGSAEYGNPITQSVIEI